MFVSEQRTEYFRATESNGSAMSWPICCSRIKNFFLWCIYRQTIWKLVLKMPLSPNKKVDLNLKPFCETFTTEEFHTNYFFAKELKVRMIHGMIHHWLLSLCFIGLCDLKVWMSSEINFTFSIVWIDGYKGSWCCWKRYKNMRWL